MHLIALVANNWLYFLQLDAEAKAVSFVIDSMTCRILFDFGWEFYTVDCHDNENWLLGLTCMIDDCCCCCSFVAPETFVLAINSARSDSWRCLPSFLENWNYLWLFELARYDWYYSAGHCTCWKHLGKLACWSVAEVAVPVFDYKLLFDWL